jgi:hypothetical protein
VKYEKPEVVQSSAAIEVIRSSMNKSIQVYDSDQALATNPAYEADE